VWRLGSGERGNLLLLCGTQRKDDFPELVSLREERFLRTLDRQVLRGDDDRHRRRRERCEPDRPSQRACVPIGQTLARLFS
jgi:hypothetical protein